MKKEQFIDYLKAPEKLRAESIPGIEMLARDFPYSATIEILLTIILYKENNIRFDTQIGRSAIKAGDRKMLKKHLCKSDRTATKPDLKDYATKLALPDKEKTTENTTASGNTSSVKKESPSAETIRALNKRIEDKLARIEREKKLKELEVKNANVAKNADLELLNEKNKNKSKPELIDQFILNAPSITRKKMDFFDPLELAEKSIIDHGDIVSETLAKIHENQGNIEKAIKIYSKLSLLFPEKNSYFAVRMEKLKKRLNNQ